MSFNRLTASLLLVVVLGVVGLGFLLGQLYRVLESDSVSTHSPAYQVLGRQLARTLGATSDLQAALHQARTSTGFELSIIAIDDLSLPKSLQDSMTDGKPLLLQVEGAQRKSALSAYFAIPQSDQLLIIDGLPVEDAGIDDGARLTLTLMFYAGLLGIVLMWLTPLVRRLSALGKVTRAFGQGDLERRLNCKGRSYIAAIEADFNQMADKIQALMADNRLLSRAVSHDLKTPLARLRFGVEMLSQDLQSDKRQKYARRVESDLHEMECLVTTLLDYARMEDQRPSLNVETIDLNFFLAKLVAQQSYQISVAFDANTAGSSEVRADARYLSMLVLNLLNNACQFANSRVSMSVQRHGDQLSLWVEDDGPGIPEVERTHVLKPFVRLPQTNPTAEKGHGMGLAIVQRLALWHGAQVDLGESSLLGGAKVVVSFPPPTTMLPL